MLDLELIPAARPESSETGGSGANSRARPTIPGPAMESLWQDKAVALLQGDVQLCVSVQLALGVAVALFVGLLTLIAAARRKNQVLVLDFSVHKPEERLVWAPAPVTGAGRRAAAATCTSDTTAVAHRLGSPFMPMFSQQPSGGGSTLACICVSIQAGAGCDHAVPLRTLSPVCLYTQLAPVPRQAA